MPQFQIVNHLIEILHLRAGLNELANGPVGRLDGFGNLVHILRLDHSLEVVFEDLGEVFCKLLAEYRILWHAVAHFVAQSHGST